MWEENNVFSKENGVARNKCGQLCQLLLKCQVEWVLKLDHGMW